MRPRRPHPSDPPINEPPAGYDWTRFGRHRLRAPGGAIVDFPLPTSASVRSMWVATVWPDPTQPGGWARQVWPLDPIRGRAWLLPGQLAAGDVVEFGADDPAGPVRWYGIMDSYEVDQWATIQGPYPHPHAAHDEAQRLLAIERYVPPLDPDPPSPPTDSGRADRRRHHHRRHRHR